MNTPAPSTIPAAAPRFHIDYPAVSLVDRPTPADAEPTLLAACIRMLKLTGGSQYWIGDTQEALEFMERAVAHALQTGAPSEHDLASALLLAQSGVGM